MHWRRKLGVGYDGETVIAAAMEKDDSGGSIAGSKVGIGRGGGAMR